VVLPNNELKLIPAVGEHTILLGKIENYNYVEKLDKLKIFYDNGLSKTGWDKYSVINLKYDHQVVGTRREVSGK
jgi:cell division protein FtsQ